MGSHWLRAVINCVNILVIVTVPDPTFIKYVQLPCNSLAFDVEYKYVMLQQNKRAVYLHNTMRRDF